MKQTFLLFIFLIVFQACDGPYDNCPKHHFSDEFKANVVFNAGSYWVYTDSLLNIIDSIHLNSQEFYFDESCKPQSQPTDVLHQNFYSSYTSNGIDTLEYFVQLRASWNPSYYSDWTLLGYFNGNLLAEDNYTYSTMDSLFINGVWYYNIKIFSNDNNKYYWSKNIGLVRKEIKWTNSNTINYFNLLRYHIN